MKCILLKTLDKSGIVDIDYDNFLDEAYKLLDCTTIETASCVRSEYLFIVDGEGKIKEPPKDLNVEASSLYPGVPIDCLCGDVLLCKRDPHDPSEFTTLNEEDKEFFSWLLGYELEELDIDEL